MRTRTTRALKLYNAQLREKIAGGSNFLKFVKQLIREEAAKLKEFRELLRFGGSAKFATKQTEGQKAIDEGTMLLSSNVCTIEDFLSGVSYMAGTIELCDVSSFDMTMSIEHSSNQANYSNDTVMVTPPAMIESVDTSRSKRRRISLPGRSDGSHQNIIADPFTSRSNGIVSPSARCDLSSDLNKGAIGSNANVNSKTIPTPSNSDHSTSCTTSCDARCVVDVFPVLDSPTVPCYMNIEQDENQIVDHGPSSTAASLPLQRMNGTDNNTCDMELDSQILVSSPTETSVTVVAENHAGEAGVVGLNSTTSNVSCMTALRQNQPEFDLSRISATERAPPTIDLTVALGLDEETVPNKYEMIRRCVENLMPNSAVHIYGSQLYDLNDAASDLNLFIDCGKEQCLQLRRSMVFNVSICFPLLYRK